MPTTLSPTDACCIALSKIGAQGINSITDQTSASAIACNTNFNLAYLEVARSGRWNCLMTPANLVEVVQTPLPGVDSVLTSINATAWAVNTFYSANSYVTYGGYYYQVMYDYTSSNNFANDLTTGPLTQTDAQTASTNYAGLDGSNYPSGWTHEYALPDDFQLLVALNTTTFWDFDGAGGDDYEIMQGSLYCESERAVIQYVKDQPDCSQWDSLFMNAFTCKLASAIATQLRQDGGSMEAKMIVAYEQALRKARTKNGGEQQVRRFNNIRSSRFLLARFGGIQG